MDPDRISISIGRKINLGNYESYDFHVSYSSDRVDDEDNDALYQRVSVQVQSWATQEEYKALSLAKTPPKGKKELRLPPST